MLITGLSTVRNTAVVVDIIIAIINVIRTTMPLVIGYLIKQIDVFCGIYEIIMNGGI